MADRERRRWRGGTSGPVALADSDVETHLAPRNYAVERMVLTAIICSIILVTGEGTGRLAAAAVLAGVQTFSTLVVERTVSDVETKLGVYLLIEYVVGGSVPLMQPDLYVPTMVVIAFMMGTNASLQSRSWLLAQGTVVVFASIAAPLVHEIPSAVPTILVTVVMTVHVVINRSGTVVDAETVASAAEFRADHDPLTDLPNRRVLMREIAADHPDEIGLVLVDLDGFKSVNDTHGHAAGDALLCAIADRMRAMVDTFPDDRVPPVVTRLGGDEFAWIVPGPRWRTDLAADELHRGFRDPVEVDDEPRPIGLSIGKAHDSDVPTADLLRAADIAMYRAKSSGAGPTWFSEEIAAGATWTEVELDLDWPTDDVA